ncbi:hypothetical protein GGTG_00884 [Gaeumannomyces tritici R3-111a-1]|uniref:Uncharacterized protein n=1 Tax=Gaeumannomyces tritici (strain R3-111a-1) TaxID=644352 RepID=J3NHZ8_GAET3|nr:hypothetical protein GGTG_00884 [Gaeumannomyces tritici R3-111a-1]EJT80891.1 hypothetical protein GGTG_00884 [Gaeumannomyces tritici R3-111a-1]
MWTSNTAQGGPGESIHHHSAVALAPTGTSGLRASSTHILPWLKRAVIRSFLGFITPCVTPLAFTVKQHSAEETTLELHPRLHVPQKRPPQGRPRHEQPEDEVLSGSCIELQGKCNAVLRIASTLKKDHEQPAPRAKEQLAQTLCSPPPPPPSPVRSHIQGTDHHTLLQLPPPAALAVRVSGLALWLPKPLLRCPGATSLGQPEIPSSRLHTPTSPSPLHHPLGPGLRPRPPSASLCSACQVGR